MTDRTNEPKTYSDRFKVVDRFNSSYWSGVDVSIYCGDVWLDDALQFGVQSVEQVNPYYGYADFIAARLHHGIRIFTGEFTINYKHSNYIYAVLHEISKPPAPGGATLDLPINYNPALGAGAVNTGTSPEDNVRSYVEYAKSFAKLRKAQDDSAARANAAINLPQMTNFAPMFRGPVRGFDITVLMGAQLNQSLTIDFESNQYTRRESPVSSRRPAPATGFTLFGVSLTGSHLMLNDSGQPFMETYSFMARGFRPLTGADIFGYTDSKPRP